MSALTSVLNHACPQCQRVTPGVFIAYKIKFQDKSEDRKGLYKELMAPIRAIGATAILCLLLIAHTINAAQFVSPNGELLKLLVRSSTGEVVVSTNTTLYTLTDELNLQQSFSYEGHFRMLAQSDVGHFMWCDSIRCNLTTPIGTSISFPTNLRENLLGDLQQFARTFLETDTIVMSATIIPQSDQNVVYVLKDEISDNSRIFLNIGNIVINNSSFLLAGLQDENLYTGFTTRHVVSTIRSDEYFYYIINQVTRDGPSVRLVRICVNDTGITEITAFSLVRAFNSYYELELQCGDSNQTSSAAYYSGDGGPHIIVSFSGVTCAYKESIISSMITNKFTQCSQGIGISGLTITENQERCIRSEGELSECKIGRQNNYALEVDTPYRGNVILTNSSRIVSMLSFSSFGFVAVFGASDDNQLFKYLVSTNSTTILSLRESFNITVGPVTSLAASPDGTLLYVLSPNKVMSYSSEQCGQYSSCSQCLDQVDPVCGWCLLDNKCSTQQSCTNQLWITSNGVSSAEECPRGGIADDVMISTEDTPYDVTVQVTNLPMIDTECTFTTGEVVTALPTQISQDRNTVTCTLTTSSLPISLFTDNDTIVLSLSLRARDSEQAFLYTTGTITVSDCTKYRKCGSCLSSSHCIWCPYSAQCTALSCSPSVGNASSCPRLVTPTNPYTVHLNVSEGLVISGSNFIEIGDHYYCVVTHGGVSLSVTASCDPSLTLITCDQRNYNFANTTGVTTASADLQVIWNTPDNVNYTIEDPMSGVQVTLYQCRLLGSNCTSCLAQKAANFDCVFCLTPSELRCSSQQSCSSQLWMTSNGVSSAEQCPRGAIADDVMISTEDTPYDVTVQVTNLPMIDTECIFTTGEVVTTLPTQVSQDRSAVTCTLTTSSLPISLFTNNDTIVLKLSLRVRDSRQNFLNTTGTITVSDCTKYRKCGSCLRSNNCTWCPYSARCTALSCSPSVGNASSCPRLVTPPNPYTVHLNVSEGLVISGSNFIEIGDHYYCVVTHGGVSLSVTASCDPSLTLITCDQRNYNFANTAGVTIASADIQVIWNTPDNVNYTIEEPMSGVQVTLYQCRLLGSNCTLCLAQKATNFDCVFCSTPSELQTSCMFDDSCRAPDRSLDTCPSPRIHQFNPVAGPIDGGTVISINGSNLGMRFDDIKSIKIGTAYCSPIESSYVVGRRINCITEVMNGSHSSNITIVADNGNHTSNEQFNYKEVRVDQVFPLTGPVSGGTILNITGENLNIGNTQIVMVQGKRCMISAITLEFITCQTPSGDDVNETAVLVLVDGFRETQSFRYVSDPTYSSIIPKYSFTSGGTTFRVFGERLDVVQSPQILFIISSRKRQTPLEYRGPCKAINATLLSCDAPELPRDVYGSTDEQVTLGLVMDGVTELLTLNVTISVFTDPIFYPLTTDNSSLVYDEGVSDVINITGRNFRFSQDQLLVRISNISTCRVIQMTSSNVECIPVDADYPVNVDLSIQVILGNFIDNIGRIRFTSTSTSNNEEDELTIIIIIVVISIIIASIVMLIIVGAVFKRVGGYCHLSSSKSVTDKVVSEQRMDHLYETSNDKRCEESTFQVANSPIENREIGVDGLKSCEVDDGKAVTGEIVQTDGNDHLKMRSSRDSQSDTEGNVHVDNAGNDERLNANMSEAGCNQKEAQRDNSPQHNDHENEDASAAQVDQLN